MDPGAGLCHSPRMRKLALALLLPLGGCVIVAAAAVGAVLALGTYKYLNNELQRDYEADYDATFEAAKKTVRDLGFHAIQESRDFARAVVNCRRSDETPVTVTVEKIDAKRVHLSVRVGTFESDENRAAAQAVHEQIYRNLGGK